MNHINENLESKRNTFFNSIQAPCYLIIFPLLLIIFVHLTMAKISQANSEKLKTYEQTRTENILAKKQPILETKQKVNSEEYFAQISRKFTTNKSKQKLIANLQNQEQQGEHEHHEKQTATPPTPELTEKEIEAKIETEIEKILQNYKPIKFEK